MYQLEKNLVKNQEQKTNVANVYIKNEMGGYLVY